MTTMPSENLSRLRQNLIEYFSQDELIALSFDLGVRYDDLEGGTISRKSLALVEYLNKRQRIPQLINILSELRPQVDWTLHIPFEAEIEPPFMGLQFFTEQNAHLFFGRGDVVYTLVEHLSDNRFLAVVGASGSGKSSVVRAGLIPAVRKGALSFQGNSSDSWLVHIITPGDEPLKALAASLTRESESVSATATLIEDMRRNSQSLDLFLYQRLAKSHNTRLLLVVDQFEELFTQCDDLQERCCFIENLVLATQSGKQGRLSLVLTLRSDFYTFALQYEELQPLLESQQKILGPMTPMEMRQAIQGPVGDKWQFQPGLIDTILEDIGNEPGSLPLLSHSLLETWKRREGRTLTLIGYRTSGGVRGAIAASAEAVYGSFSAKEQVVTRHLFIRLTELGENPRNDMPFLGTRRRVPLGELMPRSETAVDIQSVLNQLVEARLVTIDENYVEVAHEALIQGWPRLHQWLEEDREMLRLHRRLTKDAQSWLALNQDPGSLYRGTRLSLAEEFARDAWDHLSELEKTFLTESQSALEAEERKREYERQRIRRAALFALIGGGVVFPPLMRLVYGSQLQSQPLLNTLSLLWILPGAVSGFLLIVLVDMGSSNYRQGRNWIQLLLSGMGGSVAFALLLLYNVLLTTPATNLIERLLLACFQGALWGFPAGLGRFWMVQTVRPVWQTLPFISLVSGIALIFGQHFGHALGEAFLVSVFLLGALMPLAILGAAYISRKWRVTL